MIQYLNIGLVVTGLLTYTHADGGAVDIADMEHRRQGAEEEGLPVSPAFFVGVLGGGRHEGAHDEEGGEPFADLSGAIEAIPPLLSLR